MAKMILVPSLLDNNIFVFTWRDSLAVLKQTCKAFNVYIVSDAIVIVYRKLNQPNTVSLIKVQKQNIH